MRYRIEIPQSRRGYARVNFPGRIIALEAMRQAGPVWQVGVLDMAGAEEGSVTVRADSPGDAVWRVARAAVRAVSQMTGSPLDPEIRANPDDYLSNSR